MLKSIHKNNAALRLIILKPVLILDKLPASVYMQECISFDDKTKFYTSFCVLVFC